MIDYINIGKELTMKNDQKPPSPSQVIPPIHPPHSTHQIQINRPTSFYLKAETNRNFRPISNIQSPIQAKPPSNSNLFSREAFQEYGNSPPHRIETVSKECIK